MCNYFHISPYKKQNSCQRPLVLRRVELQQLKDIIPDNPHKDVQSVLATARSGAFAALTENAETDFVNTYLKPHHCANKRCISCRILE